MEFLSSQEQQGSFDGIGGGYCPGGKRDYYRKQAEKYAQEKMAIKQKAEMLEAASNQANARSEQLLHPHHRLAQGMTLIQIAISLASITALTRKRWLFSFAIVAAAGGVGFSVLAWLA